MRRTFCYLRGTLPDSIEQQREAILAFFERDGRDHREAGWYDEIGVTRLDDFDDRPVGADLMSRFRPGDELVIYEFPRLEINVQRLASTLAKLAEEGVSLTVVGREENAKIYELDDATIQLFADAMRQYAEL